MEARQIALDVFKANALELAGIARDVAESRVNEITERYLGDLLRRNPAALASFRDPDMQYAIFMAQREYARSGSEELEQMLVDLLVERATATDLVRIVLNEAITVAPKLTAPQLDTLSLILLLVHNPPFRYSFETLAEFGAYLTANVTPFINESQNDSGTYLHLKYAGCVSMDSGGVGWPLRITGALLGCFTRAFSAEQLHNIDPNGRLADILIPCFHHWSARQLKPMDEPSLRSLCAERGLGAKEVDGLLFLQTNYGLDGDAAYQLLTKLDPKFEILSNQPFVGGLDYVQLTSVGIAIANANVRRRIGLEFDLTYWIK